MVVQKNWKKVEASSQNSVNENSWNFQAPTKTLTVRAASCNGQTKQPITRQVAINTLAAMHRRFSLPGPVQPHSRPISEFRASANKSLDMLRQTIQSAVTREIDQVIKKYLEKFFVPAVNNIRLNLGEESVSEDQVRAVCRAMLDATRLLYTTPSRPTQTPQDNHDTESAADSKISRQTTVRTFQSPTQNKRKEAESDYDLGAKRKKIKEEYSETATVTTIRDPDKWNPARLTQDTLFIMGSHAHKVLGLGNARGRLYSRHAGLLRYPADSIDKEWIANHNLVNAVGGKTYIMVLEDIEELATSEAYRHNSLPMLGELTGFKVPPFMLRKIKSYVMKRALSGDISNPDSPQPSTSNTHDESKLIDEIKKEPEPDNFDTNFNTNKYMPNDNSKDFADVPNLPMSKDQTDFADIKVEDIEEIKVDGIKVEDLEEMKVDGIKVEDLDVESIKVENIEDINVDEIKVEDIKLENDDAFDLCKQSDDQNHLVDGLLEADIEFLSRNLGNIESDADARKTIEKLTGANADTITLVGDEFDLGTTLNTNNYSSNQTKCITVASTTSGMVHSVPVAHLAPPRLATTLHYYSTAVPSTHSAHPTSHSAHPASHTAHPAHPAHPALAIHTVPASTSHVIRGIPINTKSGTFSTVMSHGTAGTIIGFGSRASTAIIRAPAQYVNVSTKSFPTGNILHNAIVSRNIINRTNSSSNTGVSFNVTSVRPVLHTTAPKSTAADFDTISTAKDMIDNACNSSVMLKKVLTLGSTAAAKSFMMHNTQKVLSTGFSKNIPPPNVTIVSSGASGGILNAHVGNTVVTTNVKASVGNTNNVNTSNVTSATSGNLSATHATLSALLASSVDGQSGRN